MAFQDTLTKRANSNLMLGVYYINRSYICGVSMVSCLPQHSVMLTSANMT